MSIYVKAITKTFKILKLTKNFQYKNNLVHFKSWKEYRVKTVIPFMQMDDLIILILKKISAQKDFFNHCINYF